MDAQSKGQKGERSIKPLTAEELEQQKKKADEIMKATRLKLVAKYGDLSENDLWAHYSRELLVACARTQDLEMETGKMKVASPDENPSKGDSVPKVSSFRFSAHHNVDTSAPALTGGPPFAFGHSPSSTTSPPSTTENMPKLDISDKDQERVMQMRQFDHERSMQADRLEHEKELMRMRHAHETKLREGQMELSEKYKHEQALKKIELEQQQAMRRIELDHAKDVKRAEVTDKYKHEQALRKIELEHEKDMRKVELEHEQVMKRFVWGNDQVKMKLGTELETSLKRVLSGQEGGMKKLDLEYEQGLKKLELDHEQGLKRLEQEERIKERELAHECDVKKLELWHVERVTKDKEERNDRIAEAKLDIGHESADDEERQPDESS